MRNCGSSLELNEMAAGASICWIAVDHGGGLIRGVVYVFGEKAWVEIND